MPLEPPNHYGHLDERLKRRAAQIDAEEGRGLVPNAPAHVVKTVHFPSVNEVLERRRDARETFAARGLLLFTVVWLLCALITGYTFDYVAAAFNAVGFIVCAFVAGNRRYKKNRSIVDDPDAAANRRLVIGAIFASGLAIMVLVVAGLIGGYLGY